MGRVGDRAAQGNQGQETFDHAYPPPGIGRNEPANGSSAAAHQPRSVIPPGGGYNPQPPFSKPPPPPPHEEDLYSPHDDQDKTQAFPPPNQDSYYYPDQQQPQPQPHAFPPYFPQNAAMPTHNYTQHSAAVPQHGAVPMGQPIGHQMAGQPGMPQSAMPFNINTAAQPQVQPWSSDLFDCMNDPQNALITAFFPCVTFGQIAEIVDSGHSTCSTSGILYGLIAFCIAAPCIMSCSYRTKLRAKYGLVETPAEDWIVHCFCECCALCQEYRQLKHYGIDPTIGWLGNQDKMQRNQYPMAAPPGQRMMM